MGDVVPNGAVAEVGNLQHIMESARHFPFGLHHFLFNFFFFLSVLFDVSSSVIDIIPSALFSLPRPPLQLTSNFTTTEFYYLSTLTIPPASPSPLRRNPTHLYFI